MEVALIFAVNCESLSLAVDEDSCIAAVSAIDIAFSIDGVVAAILTEVQYRGFAVTKNIGTFCQSQSEIFLDLQLVPWRDRIIDDDGAVLLDIGDCLSEFRLVGNYLVGERCFACRLIRIAVFCYIRLSGIVRISASLDVYIGICYVRVVAVAVDIEGLARYVRVGIGDFADPVTACDADFSIVDCDLTAAAEDSDTVLNVEFGSIDGDNVFPRGVKAAGYISLFLWCNR